MVEDSSGAPTRDVVHAERFRSGFVGSGFGVGGEHRFVAPRNIRVLRRSAAHVLSLPSVKA
jgi:hypothetical protein